jgi:hypothetical protein
VAPGCRAGARGKGFIAADQHHPRREGEGLRGAGDGHAPLLQGLAQHLEDVLLELRELVEEEHAVVGERDLAGRGTEPPPMRPASLMVWCGARKGRS